MPERFPYHSPYHFRPGTGSTVRLSVVTRPRPDSSGALPLYMRVQHGDVTRYVALSLRVQARDWNPKKEELRASSPHALQMNGILADRVAAAQAAANELARSGRNFTADRLKDAVAAALHPDAALPVPAVEAPGLVAYAQQVQNTLDARGQVGTAYVYGTTITHLTATVQKVFGQDDVLLTRIDASFLRVHEGRLLSPPPTGLGHKPNYAAKQLRTLRAILRRAEQDDLPGAESAVRAFRAIRVKQERVEKVRLSFEQVQAVEAAELTGRKADARDWWLASFYLGGLRFGDLATLRWSQIARDADGRPASVRLRQRKTGDTHGLPVLPQAAALFDRWQARTGPGGPEASQFVFGLIDEDALADPKAARTAIQRANALGRTLFYRVCDQLEMPRVGPHAARHSIADHLRRSGVPLTTISMILGHSSVATTSAYLRGFDPEDVESELRRVLG